MNLKIKLTQLEKAANQKVPSLTIEEKSRLEELNRMDGNDPDYDELEHLELYMKSKPKMRFEQLLDELEEVEHAEKQT